jgi:hypothetical protein
MQSVKLLSNTSQDMPMLHFFCFQDFQVSCVVKSLEHYKTVHTASALCNIIFLHCARSVRFAIIACDLFAMW